MVSLRALAIGVTLVLAGSGSLLWAHAATTVEASVSVAVTMDVPVFTPRVALAQAGQTILFTNATAQDMRVTATPHSAASFELTVPGGGTARLTLTTPGLYHFYDAATAHVIDYQADNDVVQALPGAPNPDLPDQGWIVVPGAKGVPFDAYIHVPSSHDLIAPHVSAVRVGGSVVIHNQDTDAHNMVTDPADPAGAAFEILGTDGEPAIGGARRRVTFTAVGLYHLYCSIHTRIVGTVGGWQVVVPRDDSATGYADHDPMEEWILVVP